MAEKLVELNTGKDNSFKKLGEIRGTTATINIGDYEEIYIQVFYSGYGDAKMVLKSAIKDQNYHFKFGYYAAANNWWYAGVVYRQDLNTLRLADSIFVQGGDVSASTTVKVYAR